MHRVLRRLLAVALVVACGASYAQRFEALDSRFGEDTLIRDSNTGLEYLRLDITRGMSYNDVYEQLDTTFAGFTIATTFDEMVLSLGLHSWNGPSSLPPPSPSYLSQIQSFMTLFGASGNPSNALSLAAFDYRGPAADFDPDNPNLLALTMFHPMKVHWTPTSAYYENDSVFYYKDTVYPAISIALVAVPPVPEPGTYALMAMGLAGVGIVVRRRRGSRAAR